MLESIRLPHKDKVNLVFFTDVHLAAKPPGRRKATYMEEILAKLVWCAELTTKIQGIAICGGDLFHIKNQKSDSNPHSLVTQTLGALQQYPQGGVLGIIGNHDIQGDNLRTIPDQPIGALIQAGAYARISSVIIEVGNGLRVRVDGFDYMDGQSMLTAMQAGDVEKDEADTDTWDYRVAVAHAFNQPGKSGMMFNKDFALGWDDLDGLGYNAFLWGHDHVRKGIHKTDAGVYHVQLGSLARAAFSKDEVDRPVSAAVLSFSQAGLLVAERELPIVPLELAFHSADLAVTKVDSRADVVTFLSDLDRHATAVESEDPVDLLLTLTDDAAVIQTIKEVCELG